MKWVQQNNTNNFENTDQAAVDSRQCQLDEVGKEYIDNDIFLICPPKTGLNMKN